jgi:hypothetical protein
MGFLTNTAPTITLTAKLTPFGRQQLLLNSNSVITKFSIGDGDANYYGDLPLSNGRVPDLSGELGPNNTPNNGVYSGVVIRRPIIVNATGATKKAIQIGSNTVVITPLLNGMTTLSGNSLTQLIINRNLGSTDGNTNLFYSFGLPITQADKDLYTTFNTPTGYLNTAIRNINKDKVLVLGIEACSYGEILDGKTIKIDLATTSGATIPNYTIYSTFQKSTTALSTVDTQVKEIQYLASAIGPNIAYLFSDQVQRPNNNAALSWGTGFGLTKPFSLNNKELFNAVTVAPSTNVGNAIGIAYLDKGIIVITHPDIVNNYDTSSASTTTINFNSISNEVAQNITCIVERDEFAVSSNNTHGLGDMIRVTEVALYDNSNNVIAFGKSNEPIIIGATQYMALGVKILV